MQQGSIDKKNNKQKGNKGEELAVEYLIKKGYHIHRRNYISGKNEIDIVAQDKNTMVFVEVKERSTDYFGEPYKAVDFKKQQYIIKVADDYIRRYNIDLESRFDVISITIPPMGEAKIEHIIDAFTPQF